MSELKTAILDAKYVDMISLGDFISQDLGLPDLDADGLPVNDATEVAAAIFRWAAGAQIAPKDAGQPAEEPALEEPAAPVEQPQLAPNPWTNTATGVTDTNGS